MNKLRRAQLYLKWSLKETFLITRVHISVKPIMFGWIGDRRSIDKGCSDGAFCKWAVLLMSQKKNSSVWLYRSKAYCYRRYKSETPFTHQQTKECHWISRTFWRRQQKHLWIDLPRECSCLVPVVPWFPAVILYELHQSGRACLQERVAADHRQELF